MVTLPGDPPHAMALNEVRLPDNLLFVHLNHPFLQYLSDTSGYRRIPDLKPQVVTFFIAVSSKTDSLLFYHAHTRQEYVV